MFRRRAWGSGSVGPIIPGAGQIYAERIFGVFTVLIVTVLTVTFLAGFVLWTYGIIDEYNLAKIWIEELYCNPYERPW